MPGFSSREPMRSKADFPAVKATILTEGWSYKVSTEPLVTCSCAGRGGAGWKHVGTVLCRRGGRKDMAGPGGRGWSILEKWEQSKEDGDMAQDLIRPRRSGECSMG